MNATTVDYMYCSYCAAGINNPGDFWLTNLWWLLGLFFYLLSIAVIVFGALWIYDQLGGTQDE